MSEKTFTYKGYTGSIEFSLEDECLYGEVLFVNDLINYEGETLQELQAAFRQAVDYYLEKCAREGLTPDKPCSGSFNVRISPTLHREASIEAAKKGVKLNEFVKGCIAEGVAQAKERGEHAPRQTFIFLRESFERVREQAFDKPSELWPEHLNLKPVHLSKH